MEAISERYHGSHSIRPGRQPGFHGHVDRTSGPMTHAVMPSEFRQNVGISDSLLRISVGIEDVEDITSDLDQALEKV